MIPPIVYEVSMPSSHRAIRMSAMVVSIGVSAVFAATLASRNCSLRGRRRVLSWPATAMCCETVPPSMDVSQQDRGWATGAEYGLFRVSRRILLRAMCRFA
jgi:hypothetical protein